MNEMMFDLKQMVGGGHALGQVALLVCLFMVFLYRPDRVRIRLLFALSCLLLACSIIVPPTLSVLMRFFQEWPTAPFKPVHKISADLLELRNASGPALFGLSLLCGFASLSLAPREQSGLVIEELPAD